MNSVEEKTLKSAIAYAISVGKDPRNPRTRMEIIAAVAIAMKSYHPAYPHRAPQLAGQILQRKWLP